MSTSRTHAAEPARFLGLDFGTSGARANLIDAEGSLRWQAALAFPDNNWQEWRLALFDLLARVPLAEKSHLQAIAICGTSATSLLCDAAGEPLLPALLYNDGRAQAQAQVIESMAGQKHLAATATSSLAKLLWLLGHAAPGKARLFFQQADWLAFMLHGQPGISDYHNCLKLGYDAEHLQYPRWLSQHAIARFLPRVLEPGAVIGPLLSSVAASIGLPADCVVRAGTTDSIAAFLASGAKRPGQAVTSLGSTLVLKLLSRQCVEAPQYGIYSHRCGSMWLAGGASNCGGKVLDDIFGKASLTRLSAQIDTAACSGLDYYPLPATGERFPVNDPTLQPRLQPRPADPVLYLQGLLESLARIEAQGYRLLSELGATPVSEVFTAGGGAANTAWSTIRRKALGVPIATATHTEAAYGAALIAARGTQLLYSSDT